MGTVVRGTVPALLALLAGVLTGCAEPAEGGEGKPSASAGRPAEERSGSGSSQETVRSGGSVGAAGSACALPVTFETAEKWRPQAVETGAPGGGSGSEEEELAAELAEGLLHQGPFTAACEIDAKPAGNIGFLRVWTGEAGAKGGEAKALLKKFVAAEGGTSEAEYHAFRSDSGVSGAEVEYLYTSEALGETKKERAFLTVTPKGPVVVHLGGLDTEEHEEMLPAYELARRTLSTI
ncbi:lipoprotein [Streptomyces sp. VNUA24]|uniref:lipoprotein n=1 Tax=Streptomyces sp. VNUA24 TaxID=3031131 RepID=UPI0023B85489|nr:lipoprotein [Streptomyces sp. VNUA24]WEH17512.1 lipoprotein [Streptomyces sp. VNUA24]